MRVLVPVKRILESSSPIFIRDIQKYNLRNVNGDNSQYISLNPYCEVALEEVGEQDIYIYIKEKKNMYIYV